MGSGRGVAGVGNVVRRVPGARRVAANLRGPGSPEVAILGAGFGGMAMAIQLLQAGITSFTIYEKGDGVGGTWRDNTYPGAACDAPSHLYSFSFAPNPGWSRQFAPQAEILHYLEGCAESFGLVPHIRFGTAITVARFDDAEGRWHLQDANGGEHTADVVVSGLGQLNRPKIPDIGGLDTFAGHAFHSARWDHEHDLRGRSVAVIGTAASAVQFVPPVAAQAGRLEVFQRSPNWVLPKPDLRFPPAVRTAFARVPGLAYLYRALIYWLLESRLLAFRDREKRGPQLEKFARTFLDRQVRDPELRAKLLPDYPIGCNRMLISSDYYAALTRDDVSLVTDAIDHVEPSGIVTADGALHEVDTIIFGTGFDATKFLAPLEITGRGGRRLEDAWQEGAEAYWGVAIADFPNLFLLYGPNTNLGHNSIVFMIESQVGHILRVMAETRRRGARWATVRADAEQAYNDEIQAELRDSVWAAGCSSWYTTESGRITNNWPDYTYKYWWAMRGPDFDAYEFGGDPLDPLAAPVG